MTAYLIKNALCLFLFLGAYKVIFERERMHGFNRYYLLSSILASLLIPLISFKASVPAASYLAENFPATVDHIIESNNSIPSSSGAGKTAIPSTGITLAGIIILIYWAVTALMAARLIVKLGFFIKNIGKGEKISINGIKIMLIDWETAPCAFWKTVYINRDDFEAGKIEDRIIHHENIHVRQIHSADRLAAEILQIFMWFNPLIYLYKNAILLNHEYMADRGVIDKYKDSQSYLILLVNSSARCEYIQYPSSSFNSKTIKKRVIMMTKQKSRTKMLLKGFSVIPLLACSLILLSGRTAVAIPSNLPESAQNETTIRSTQPTMRATIAEKLKEIAPNILMYVEKVPEYRIPEGEGASQSEIDEYAKIEDKYKTVRQYYKSEIELDGAKDDVARMEKIFIKMTNSQRDQRNVIFFIGDPLEKRVPTSAQINEWKEDAKKFDIWINGNRVDNSQLGNYKNSDFSYYTITLLAANDKRGGNHEFRVSLSSHDKFEKDNRAIKSGEDLKFLVKEVVILVAK